MLRDQFAEWAGNDTRFQAMAEGNALLTEVKPLSKDLAALGTMGLQILDYMLGRATPPADWVAAQTRELTRMQRPTAEVNLAAARPVKLLLDGLKR